MTKRALYFGCWDRPGHFLHDETGKVLYWPNRDAPTLPWTLGHMDGGLLKNGEHPDVIDGKVWWTCGGRDEFWYAFFWWDRSVDRRGACNSGFYVSGFKPEVLSPETARENASLAFAFACETYPAVVARQRCPLVLQP